MCLGIALFPAVFFFLDQKLHILGIRHLGCLHSIKAVILRFLHPYFSFYKPMFRAYGQAEIKSLPIGKPSQLLAQHPVAFHALHICNILVLKDIFPGIKLPGHILGILREIQPVFLSLIPGKSVIIH